MNGWRSRHPCILHGELNMPLSKPIKLFLDSEFTGMHQQTTLISLALVSECGASFYAEFNDYDTTQIDSWIQYNVMDSLLFSNDCLIENGDKVSMKDNTEAITLELKKWLSKYDDVEIWSNRLAYDWVLFNNLFGNALNIPKNIYFIPFDLSTLFKMKGVDPNISKEEFSENIETTNKHNALYNAFILRKCHNKLMLM